MLYIVILILLLILIIDLLLYVPIRFHIYQSNECFYVYFFGLPIIKIDEKSHLNILENKIDVNKVIDTDSSNLKIIKEIKIDKIYIRINKELTYTYSYIFYPLLSLDNIFKVVDYKICDSNKFYISFNFKLVNIILKIIQARRKKNEGTSN